MNSSAGKSGRPLSFQARAISAETARGVSELMAQAFSVDWTKVVGESKTTPTLQIVVNSKLKPGERVREGAYRAFRDLDPEYVRFVPWFPYPHMAVAELDAPTAEGTSWDFTHVDPPTIDFLEATKGRNPVVNFSTIPAWMFRADLVVVPEDPDEIFFRYNEGVELVDPTGAQVSEYFARLVAWYTKGGFTDELGMWHESGHHYELPIWEVLNEADVEHSTTPQMYTERYDLIVQAIREVSPNTQFVGLGVANVPLGVEYFEYFLNPDNHAEGIPLDWISYHFYAMPSLAQSIDEWQYTFFDQADRFLTNARYIESIRKRLSPSTRTMVNELGIILAEDALHVVGVDMGDWTIPDDYWNLAGALYAYLVVELAKMGIDVAGESQLVGYPGQFPSVSMVDWETGEPNARFQVLKLLRDHFGPGDQFVEHPLTGGPLNMGELVGFPTMLPYIREGRRTMLYVNRTADTVAVELEGAGGGTVHVVDVTTGSGPIAEYRLESSTVELRGYAVAVVTLPDSDE